MKGKRSIIIENPHELQDEIKKVYDSKNNKMSRGAENIAESRPQSRGGEYYGRRKNHKKAL